MAGLKRSAAVAALALLSACASGGSTPSPVPMSEPTPWPSRPQFEVKQPTGEYDDLTSELQTWKSAVLDRVDGPGLAALKAHFQSRVDLGRARDAELQTLPPGIAIERRLELARRLAFDEACLKLIEERAGKR